MITAISIFLGAFLVCIIIYAIVTFSYKIEVKLDDNTKLSDIIPIHSIQDDFIINGEGDLTIGYTLMFPEIFTLSESEVRSIHNSLDSLLCNLPAGSVFHQQNFIYTKDYSKSNYSDNYLHSTNLSNLKGKELLHGYTNIYITFTKSSFQKKDATNTPLLRKPALPFKEPFDIKRRLSEIETYILSIETNLSGINKFKATRLNSFELNNALYDYLSLGYDNPVLDASQKVLDPIGIDESGNMKIGNKSIAILSMVSEGTKIHTYKKEQKGAVNSNPNITLPDTKSMYVGMLYPLTYGLPFNHITNVVIEVLDNDETAHNFDKEKAGLNLVKHFYPSATRKEREIQDYIDTVNNSNYRSSYTAVNVIIHDSNSKELAQKVAHAQQAFSHIGGANSYTENEETANLFFASLAGSARAIYRGFYNTVIQALCYLNKEGLYISSKRGHLFFDRFGNPILMDLWHNPLINNRNRIVIGPSGSGKSFFLNTLVLNCITMQHDTIIFDVGGSFKNLVLLNKGKYYDSRENKSFQFNPFLCPKDEHGNYKYIGDVDDDGEGAKRFN